MPVKMACLQAGTVLSATVEQVLENCLLVYVKHRSKIFRGVLFDEKNAVVWRTTLHEQSRHESVKEKGSEGGGVGDGAVRWSSRQASLFYRRQNNKYSSCRRVPSLFSGVEVLTDADLIKKSEENSENKMGEVNTSTKRPSATSDQKTKQTLLIRAKEISRRKTSLSRQMDVKRSRVETNLKRKSSSQDIGNRPSKRKPDSMKVAGKGVQKNADKKRSKVDYRRPQKTEVGNGSVRSVGSKESTAKSVSSMRYKSLMTRPCSIPVVPVATASSARQRQRGAVVVPEKDSSSPEIERVPSSESLVSLIDENVDKDDNDKDDRDENEEGQLDENLTTSGKSLVSLVPLSDGDGDEGAADKNDKNEDDDEQQREEANLITSSKSLASLVPLTVENGDMGADKKDYKNEAEQQDEEIRESMVSLESLTDGTFDKGADDDQEKEADANEGGNPTTSSESSVSVTPLTDEYFNKSVKYDHDSKEQPDEEMNLTREVVENEDEPILELTNPINDESVPRIVTDNSETDPAKHDNGDTCDVCELLEALDSGMDKNENTSAVSSDLNDERTDETKGTQTENVIIKRSARISERRANFSVHSLLKGEKLAHKKSFVESNEMKVVVSDYSQADTVNVSKTLSHNNSSQPDRPDKKEMPSTIRTQQNPIRHKSTASSTKYTQRMSWKLQPTVTPIDKTNMVSVGDIVWGKVHGHPWWPGRVMAISGVRNEESNNPWDRDAHVSWFGSNTSSIMRVHGLQLFLPNFAKRHKRNKKGFYRVAVREAQEALQAMPAKE